MVRDDQSTAENKKKISRKSCSVRKDEKRFVKLLPTYDVTGAF